MLNTNFRRLVVAFAIPVAGLGAFLALSRSATSATGEVPESIKQAALGLVKQRQRNATSTSLKIANAAKTTYPLSGKTAYEIKLTDSSGVMYGVTLNGSGQEVSSGKLRTDEQAVYKARYGKLSQNLANKIANASQNQPIKVMLWLKAPSSSQVQRPASSNNGRSAVSQAQVNTFYQQVDAQRAAAIQPVVNSVASRVTALGTNVTTEKYSPVVYATLTPQAIRQVAQLSEVDQVYEVTQMKPTMEFARKSVLADIVESRGITGSGIRVGEIEVGGRINTANPYLAGVTQDTTYSCLHPHAAAVAGDIRSTHPTVRGVAPNVSLWIGGSCGGWFNELTNRSTAAADWGARVFNLSLGGESNLVVDGFAKYYDDLVINRFRTVVVAAGNEGDGNGNVLTPGVAYNIITVGSFDDKNNPNWSDDVMSWFSSWRNPKSTYGDRQKPEVAAPGQNIDSTINSAPWIGNTGSGTSYASPIVAGIAAQLIQRSPSLGPWPEQVKAIIMTSAVHNIEGNTRLSEYDGAGGVAADRADDIARGVGGNSGARGYACDANASLDVATISLTAGQRTRATIVWDNNPEYSDYANRPSADLDFQIVNASDQVVTSSSSFDNTYEIVDFTPSTSGTYKLRVKKWRCDLTPKYLGWAWRQGN